MSFPAYRRYEATRQEANNAMMALLAGSKLAAHTLQLTEGSSRLLPEIFPAVDHIRYFNLRPEAATEILVDTGHHLGAVAVPYALAVHEDFLTSVLELLAALGYQRRAPGDSVDTTRNRVQAWNMHEAVWLTLGEEAPRSGAVVPLEHFHLLREMRNAQIHGGGAVSQRLAQQVASMSVEAASAWTVLGRRPPTDVLGTSPLRFTTFDIFAAFATTKSLGRVVNTLLRDSLSPPQWAALCVEDYCDITTKFERSDSWMRGLLGHAAMHYGAGPLTEQDVVDAAVAAGKWTAGRVPTPRRAARRAKAPRDPGRDQPTA